MAPAAVTAQRRTSWYARSHRPCPSASPTGLPADRKVAASPPSRAAVSRPGYHPPICRCRRARATRSTEAGLSGSSRTCHLRSNHRAHHPLRQADPRLDHPTAAALPPRPSGGPGWWCGAHPAAPGPRGVAIDIRLPWEPARPQPRPCRPIGCAAGFRSCCARSAHQPPRRNPAGAPRAGPKGRASGPAVRHPANEKADQETQEEATHHHQGRLTGPTRLHARRPRLMGRPTCPPA